MFRWPRFCRRRTLPEGFDERRKFLRLDTKFPVQYSIVPKDKEKEIKQRRFHKEAKVKNIGGGGLLVEIPILAEELLLTTHLIEVKFTLPEDKEPIDAIARIVCVEKPEYIEGFYLRLEFVRISDENRKRLMNYIRAKDKKR